ncbi:MAG: putative serine/threonine phosphatase [Myxococcales bacterium]|nr:putative serine/threonine phosphatase [Myxococcales bacterium]
MGLRSGRLFASFPLACLALALVGAPTSSAWAAKKKKPAKTWPSRRSTHKTETKAAPASSDADEEAAPAAQKGGGDDEEDDKPEATKSKSSKAAKVKMDEADDADDDDKRAGKSKDDDDSSGGDEGDAPVVRKKAKKQPVADEGEGGAPVAFTLDIGSRGMRRTFDFNDPRFYDGTTWPGAYRLKAAPVPFLHVGIYPLAFAGRDGLANIGLVGRYERLVGVSTKSGGTTASQEFDVGLRGRLPLGGGEVGLSATYGQHTFLLTGADLPPSNATTVPNVEYTFVRADLDGAADLGPITLGGHVGTRFVPKTGALGTWFGTTKTTSIEAGISAAYRLTPVIQVVAGADYLRYAFAFSPPRNNGIVAGGAVDQYISGFLALRVSVSGG